MIKHCILVAFRNLAKHSQQTVISIIGLAVGFVCFALSVYWVRYERGFDGFHANADRIYQVREIDQKDRQDIRCYTSLPLASRLEEHFLGIKATGVNDLIFNFESGNDAPDIKGLEVDERFFEMFDVDILQGTFDVDDERGVLVTPRFAREYLQTDSPIGKELIYYVSGKEYQRFRIRGIVKEWSRNTNLPFDILKPVDVEKRTNWGVLTNTYVQIDRASDLSFVKKRLEHFQQQEALATSYLLVPLTEVRYTEPVYRDIALKFDQVVLFAGLGLLVVMCSLFNYLNLYASCIRMRTKELLLRKVNGASRRQIFSLLMTECGLLLLIAFVFGFIGVEWLLPSFKKFANIQSDRLSIYRELAVYALLLISISFIGIFGVVTYLHRGLFQNTMRRVSTVKSDRIFARTGVWLQLMISFGFIFCTTLYFKQIHTLNTAYTGVERKNIISVLRGYDDGSVSWMGMSSEMVSVLLNALQGESSIEAIMPLGYGAIYPRVISTVHLAKTDEEVRDEDAVEFEVFTVHPDYLSFYGLQLIAGEDFGRGHEPGTAVILNEAAVKALGFTDPIGKTFFEEEKPYYDFTGSIFKQDYRLLRTVIGVVNDFIFESPLEKVRPVVLIPGGDYSSIAVKYREGEFLRVKEVIERIFKQKFPGQHADIYQMEAEYRKMYESEINLRFLLALLSGVCVTVSLFGVYSMVSLSGEQRRKEIAVRKINGASLSAIFGLFLKEYMILSAIGVFFAFPVGYVVMKPWIERFVVQTSIDWWFYLFIFMATTGVILLTVISRIWKTAHINPVVELKRE